MDNMELQSIKEYIDQRDSAVEQKIKLWIISSVLAQIITLCPIIFFLGGIYQSANASFELMKSTQVEMEARGRWMQDRERWEMAMESWAETNGFKPPKYNRNTNGGER